MIHKEEQQKIIGLLYTDALAITDAIVKTHRTRALLTELYSATLGDDTQKSADHKIVMGCRTKWREAQQDVLDGEPYSANAICFDILDEVSDMVKNRYGAMDAATYKLATKV